MKTSSNSPFGEPISSTSSNRAAYFS